MSQGLKKSKERKLTPKQEKFVSEYIKTGNATEAYKRAGYAVRSAHAAQVNGSRMLLNDVVSRAIEARRKKLSEKLELDDDFELKKAIRLLDMCMEPHQVCNMKGEPAQDESGMYVMAFDSKGANMALQTIVKLRGKFVTKVQVGMADDIAEALGGIKE